MVEAEFQHLVGGQVAVEIRFDVGHLTDLIVAIIGHAAPCRKAGEKAFARDAPANLVARFGQCNVISAFAQGPRGF